ncbi:MAG: hypothetical protein RIR62_3030 [Pseudomonadota bacterium]
MSLDACAALVERGDPDRFAAMMAAPVAARGPMAVLFAFNLEVARAPWVTKEPLIAEMRLQFWRDVVAEAAAGRTRAHEVAGPLANLIRDRGLPAGLLDRMVEARRADIYPDGFADQAAMDAYLEDTGAGLMWATALALGAGAEAEAEAAVRAHGHATALVAWLRAVPELEARGHVPLVDGREVAVAALARTALARLARDGAGRPRGLARAALLPAWQTGALLRQVARDPARVGLGQMGLSPFGRQARLLRAAFLGL